MEKFQVTLGRGGEIYEFDPAQYGLEHCVAIDASDDNHLAMLYQYDVEDTWHLKVYNKADGVPLFVARLYKDGRDLKARIELNNGRYDLKPILAKYILRATAYLSKKILHEALTLLVTTDIKKEYFPPVENKHEGEFYWFKSLEEYARQNIVDIYKMLFMYDRYELFPKDKDEQQHAAAANKIAIKLFAQCKHNDIEADPVEYDFKKMFENKSPVIVENYAGSLASVLVQ